MNKNINKVCSETLTKEKYMDHWTSTEKENCKSLYGCDILLENVSYADVCTKEVPNDAHIVKYCVEDKICFDLTRGNRTKLFDMYWDKFRENLKSIGWGHGKLNPRTWGYQAPKSKKRK